MDFYLPWALLCVEVDGPEHRYGKVRQADGWRDSDLKSLGIRTIRVTNAAVDADPAKVARQILSAACRRTGLGALSHADNPLASWKGLPPPW